MNGLLCWFTIAISLAAPAAPPGKKLFLWFGQAEVVGLSRQSDGDRPAVWVVQSHGPSRELRLEIARRGLAVLGYLEQDAFLVEARASELLPLAQSATWGRWPEEWKLSPELGHCSAPARLRVVAWPGRNLAGIEEALPGAGRLLRLSRDVEGTGHALVECENDVQLVARRLAGLESAAWIEPERSIVLDNDDAAWVIQGGDFATGSTPLFDHGLIGTGQIIAVTDSGLDSDACQFRYSASASAQTLYNTTQPPAANVTNPQNKVITYYLLDGADAYDDYSKQGHGTHVAGSAAGDNYAHLASGSDPGRDTQDGMAPAARLVIQDAGRRDGNQTGLPDSLLDLFQQAYDSGARIHNDSYGKTDPDTGYSSNSREVDAAAWRLQDLTIVFSSGNLGPAAGTLDGLGATAKNSIVVGASLAGVSNRGYGVCHFSSQGPTSDGRLRPDLVAPGAVRSARETDWIPRGGTDIFGNPTADSTTDPPDGNCSVDDSFRVGTSFAAPLVAGAAALTRQYFAQGLYPPGVAPAGGFSPSAALVKAVLVNSAESIGPAPNSVPGPLYDVSRGEKISDLPAAPNPIEGWGLLRLDRTLAFAGDTQQLAVLADVWNDGVDRGVAGGPPLEESDERGWTLRSVAAGSVLRVTLCWTDPPGATGSGRVLVNDLDLEVEAGGHLFRGNVNLVENRSQPAEAQPADQLNPLEQVILAPPGTGDVVVRVVATRVPGNGSSSPFPSWQQGFALVAAGSFAGVCVGEECEPLDAGDGWDGGGQVDAGGDERDGGTQEDGAPAADDVDSPGDRHHVRITGGCACGADAGCLGPGWLVLLLFIRRRR